MEALPLSSLQTDAILDLQIYRLTGLEMDKIDAEYKEILERIAYLKELLGSEALMINVIREELIQAASQYEDGRRTSLVEAELGEWNAEDLIPNESCVVLITRNGYIKRSQLSAYQNQNRGTVGRRGVGLKEEDVTIRLFVASAHDQMLFFTRKGKVYWKKAYEIPESEGATRGRPINRIIEIEEDDQVCSVINVSDFETDSSIMFFTRRGYVKKTPLLAFSRPRARGIIAALVPEEDALFEAQLVQPGEEIIMGTSRGLAIRFLESDVRMMGRTSRGVMGIRLSDEDVLVGADVIREGRRCILTVTELGMGKKSEADLYRLQHRGGKGLINMRLNEKTGLVIGLVTLDDQSDIVLCSAKGVINRFSSTVLRAQGRITQGVKVIHLRGGDKLVSLDKAPAAEEGEDLDLEAIEDGSVNEQDEQS